MRPAARPLLLGACGLCVLVLLAALSIPAIDGSRASRSHASSSIPAPLVINAHTSSSTSSPATSSSSTPTASLVSSSQVRALARRFVRSYLPVLYGRRPARSVHGVDRHVRESLTTAGKPPQAPRRARPRLTSLKAKPQSEGSVLEIATISDRVRAPYRIAFLIGRAEGGLRVTELANY